jgi:hypothetical protein
VTYVVASSQAPSSTAAQNNTQLASQEHNKYSPLKDDQGSKSPISFTEENKMSMNFSIESGRNLKSDQNKPSSSTSNRDLTQSLKASAALTPNQFPPNQFAANQFASNQSSQPQAPSMKV